ncbi:MAG: YgiT-type zinc finger protein [Planctomycetota bacterium]|nr:YgiT-type zinc finger protein [Planctomycetota bacterium]
MKCTLCHGDHIAKSTVQERIPVGNDIVLVSIEVLVCQLCGERFYDRATMHRLEELEDDLAARKRPLREIGKVLELISG